jgi:hypothetical protein
MESHELSCYWQARLPTPCILTRLCAVQRCGSASLASHWRGFLFRIEISIKAEFIAFGMERDRITADVAFGYLSRASQDVNPKLTAVARHLVETVSR